MVARRAYCQIVKLALLCDCLVRCGNGGVVFGDDLSVSGAPSAQIAVGEATGRFRMQKIGKAWWLVDPEGRPSRDLGAGSDANASDGAADGKPFVCFVSSASRKLGAMSDPFDGCFRSGLGAALSGRTCATNRQCVGVLVDRGVDFGARHEDLARRTLAAADDQPAKVEFLKRLKAKGVAYDPAMGPDQLPSALLCEFTDALVWEYFYQARSAVKRFDPNLLYLGCRFAAPPPPWVVEWGFLHTDAVCGDGLGGWRPKEMDVPVADPETLCRPTPGRVASLRPEDFAVGRDETSGWQGAIDAAWKRGGGTVEMTPGRHRVHGLRLRSNVTLHLQSGAVLESVRDGTRFGLWQDDRLEPIPPPVPGTADRYFTPDFRALIRLHAATNAAIVGEPGSVIDGCNSYHGDPKSEEGYRGVHGILAYGATNCVFRGYRMYRSGNWSHHIRASKGLHFENVTIEAGHDGIHLLRCRDIVISGCTVATGDDAIAGYGNEDVRVRGCTLSSACNIFRFGGRRVTIEDCTAKGPCSYPWRNSLSGAEKSSGHGDARGRGRRNTLAFYTYFGIGANMRRPLASAGEIVIRNVTVENVDRLLHYDFAAGGRWQSIPLDGIRLEGVTATGIARALCARGTAEHPLALALRDSRIGFRTQQRELINGADVSSLELEDVSVTGVTGPAFRDYGGRPPAVRVKNVSGLAAPTARGGRLFPAEHY